MTTVKDKLRELKEDRALFAKKYLKIKTKGANVSPLIYNKAQIYINQKLDEQLEKTGKVRAYILKGRQQGCSTYVSSRYYHKSVFNSGYKVFILTHHSDATNNLFRMAKRFYQKSPPPLRPSISTSNAKELIFDRMESEYKVATAGNEGAGRSDTIHLFHGSEVAFWPNAHEHAAGAMQAVSDAPGTEVILESTANGIGNFFHEGVMEALRGESDYQLIFVPWFWQDEYTSDFEGLLELDEEEVTLREAYGLSDGQLVWRRKKIKELKSVDKFRQEYPNSVEEAFLVTGHASLIQSDFVRRARKHNIDNPYGAKVLGIDVATGVGRDRSALCYRQGRKVHWIKYYDCKEMELVGHIKAIDAVYNFDRLNFDLGMGGGVFDRAKEVIPRNERLFGINFGAQAVESHKYKNKRAEMWSNLAEWFEDQPCDIPDSEELEMDLLAPAVKPDSNSRIVLEAKEDMRKRIGFSPDGGDALALTFDGRIAVQASAPMRTRGNVV